MKVFFSAIKKPEITSFARKKKDGSWLWAKQAKFRRTNSGHYLSHEDPRFLFYVVWRAGDIADNKILASQA